MANRRLVLAGGGDQSRSEHPAAEGILIDGMPQDGFVDGLQFTQSELARQQFEADRGVVQFPPQTFDGHLQHLGVVERQTKFPPLAVGRRHPELACGLFLLAFFRRALRALFFGAGWLGLFLLHMQRRQDDVLVARALQQFVGVNQGIVGDRNDPRVPDDLRNRINDAEELTKKNDDMHMVFAFNYGGRAEIISAVRKIVGKATAGELQAEDIDVDTLAGHLYLPEMPDPDLVIRTSGELRTSNYLLWEAAYSEYVFTPVLWPDFDRHTLAACIAEYQSRDRRFGGAIDASAEGV